MRCTFRFAPSPNGYLHLGHAYSALLNAELARRCHGRLLLRIEDIDLTRCRPEFEQAIEEDLAWLGLDWERPVRRQSEHFDDYRSALEVLLANQLVYRCFCSRKQIAAATEAEAQRLGRPWPTDPDGAPLYPGTCRGRAPAEIATRLAHGEAFAWRLDNDAARRKLTQSPGGGAELSYTRFAPDGQETPVIVDPSRWGDAVVMRKEIPASYHLAVVVDDALQGVTHVVRGEDLEAATDLHRLLQVWLNLPTPRYFHHPLIRGTDDAKLAKSLKSEPLRELRARGLTPEQVRLRLPLPN